MPLTWAPLPFILHVVIEMPASLSFALKPSSTLLAPQPHAHPVIRQYALLLMSTNIIAGMCALHDNGAQSSNQTSGLVRWVAGALALYHLGPITRAMGRHQRREGSDSVPWAQPWVHVLVHCLCGVILTVRAINGW